MSSYRVIWFLFMLLLFIPGFLFASSVEGIEFWEATEVIRNSLNNAIYFPHFLANALSVPVTIFAAILPGTSSSTLFLGNMIWPGLGLVFTFFALIRIRPPFHKSEVDLTQNKNAFFRSRPFSRGLGILLVFWLLAEISFAFLRDPIADTYVGNVYFVENGKPLGIKRPIKATAKVDVVDVGFVYDKRPGVYFDGIRVEITGEEVSKLQGLGAPEKLLSQAEDRSPFSEHFCQAKKATSKRSALPYSDFPEDYNGGQIDYAAVYHFKFSQTEEINCKGMHFGVIDFDYAQLAIDGINKHGFILIDLKRDSHISPLQRFIMRLIFDRNNISTKYGSRV